MLSYALIPGVATWFYVSSPLMRGRKADAGTIGRVAGQDIETIVLENLKDWLSAKLTKAVGDQDALEHLKGVTLYSEASPLSP